MLSAVSMVSSASSPYTKYLPHEHLLHCKQFVIIGAYFIVSVKNLIATDTMYLQYTIIKPVQYQ